ncbi:ATP-binding protein [Gimesia maris]|uniref:ATP-binding protein n=1 Tax=Gimesia maris TaxID=122 RepID=UPI0032F09BE0
MKTDVRGKVSNVKLGRTRCLQPLFEAIMNSIHAVQEAKPKGGRINVEVIRNTAQKELFEGNTTNFPVSGFVVRDNGIGFTEKHFESFDTADTTEKITRGGKGVGRFLWLKAFERAEIQSVFRSNGHLQKRAFTFCLSKNGIDPPNPDAISTEDSEPTTEVKLCGFHRDYQRHCPKTAITIAHRIIEHFLELFILKKCPNIVLNDELEETTLDLNRLFESEMKLETKSQRFSIRGMKFQLNHVRLAAPHAQQHTLSFCAHGRSVRTDFLVKLAPYLDPSIPDHETGQHFNYAGYVSGNFLDENVMSERTQFDISEERSALEFPDELGWPDLIDVTLPKIQKFLNPHILPLGEAKMEHIRQYISEKAPQYRHLLGKCKKAIEKIPSNLTDEKLDLELYKIDQQHDLELKNRYDKLLAAGDSKTLTHEKQKQRFEDFLEDWNEAGMAKLARHVAHRKATLTFLEQRLALQDDGNYAREEAVHEVIFPLKTTSDEVKPDQMNLWILDEKLAFHFYLASDKPLNQMKNVLEVDSLERPDLAIFGHPFAFADSSPAYGSVVLVEFKRPLRDDYNEKKDKNPIQQVYNYVELIKSGKAKDRNGRPIKVLQGTPFYGYIVCDMMSKLEEQAKYAQLTKTPDGMGYFGYNAQVGVYVEIISFDKVVADAKKRNAVFFEKLGVGK